jgi:hypothetical protein
MADFQHSGGYTSESDYGFSPNDAPYYDAPETAEVSRATLLMNWAGAVVSIGLVLGMAIWAWQLLMRDVTDVPVITAMEGPMRVAPENPGGAVAANQGLAVNRLAEGEEAGPVPDQLTLAPPPVEMDDMPEIEQAFESASAATALPAADAEAEPTPIAEAEAEAEALPAAPEDTDALIERLLAEAQPLEPVEGEAQADAAPASNIIPASVPGVSRSLRPALRPAGIRARAEVATLITTGESSAETPETPEAAVTEVGLELASAELEAGTRLVQLGAFDTQDLARGEWDRLAQLYPDFFLGRARVIEQATSGGQDFYRLRAHGFADLSASRRFCAALVAQGAACIPVTVR